MASSLKGEVDAIRRIFTDINRHPTPTKIPAGKLILDFGGGMAGILPASLACAEAGVTFERGERDFPAKLSACAEAGGFVKVSIPSDAYSVHLKNPDFGVKGRNIPICLVCRSNISNMIRPCLARKRI